MIKGQTLVASDGLEVALYPLESVRITQTHYGGYSHSSFQVKNTGLADVTGVSGDNPKGEIYAPFTAKVITIKTGYAGGNQVLMQSTNKVHLANGEIDYACFGFAHDNNLDVKVGEIVKQGQKVGDCGNYGYATGVHSHFLTGKGQWQYGTTIPCCKNKNGSYIYYMPNAIDLDDLFYVNDIRTFGNGTITKNDDGTITQKFTDSGVNVTFTWKTYKGKSIDLTQFIVERDESKHQVEITKEILRARNDTIISDETYLGVKMPVGIYNVVEIVNANNYNWVKVADGVYFALTGDCYIEYQPDTTDYKKLYKALETKYKALQSDYDTLTTNYSSIEKELTQAKEKINKAISDLK